MAFVLLTTVTLVKAMVWDWPLVATVLETGK
jgi:hypothetical protein